MKPKTELLQQLKFAAQEEIMCREASDKSDAWQDLASPENILALIEIALPVLEQQDSKDVFVVVRKPGHLPYIKRPVGDVADYLLQIYQHNPEVSCDVVTNLHRGPSGQWVQDGRELLAMLEVAQPSTPQIDNDVWIEWAGGECPVAASQKIEVRLREKNGVRFYGSPAENYEWAHSGSGYDIIAYRVIGGKNEQSRA